MMTRKCEGTQTHAKLVSADGTMQSASKQRFRGSNRAACSEILPFRNRTAKNPARQERKSAVMSGSSHRPEPPLRGMLRARIRTCSRQDDAVAVTSQFRRHPGSVLSKGLATSCRHGEIRAMPEQPHSAETSRKLDVAHRATYSTDSPSQVVPVRAAFVSEKQMQQLRKVFRQLCFLAERTRATPWRRSSPLLCFNQAQRESAFLGAQLALIVYRLRVRLSCRLFPQQCYLGTNPTAVLFGNLMQPLNQGPPACF